MNQVKALHGDAEGKQGSNDFESRLIVMQQQRAAMALQQHEQKEVGQACGVLLTGSSGGALY